MVVERLVKSFPAIQAPTPAQLAFLLTIQRGASDVYFKDHMGRGKTFSVVLAALTLVLSGKKVLLLVPTPHLARQVEVLCKRLYQVTAEQPAVWTLALAHSDPRDEVQPLLISTPRTLQNWSHWFRFEPDWVLLDEPDTMLGPLPPRDAKPERLARHPLIRHPPPIIDVLDGLFDAAEGQARPADRRNPDGRKQSGRKPGGGKRREIRTAWSSATLQNKVKTLARQRGWVSAAADLNWTAGASPEQQAVREDMEAIAAQLGGITADSAGWRPEHYALEVGRTGALRAVTHAEVEAAAADMSAAHAALRERRAQGESAATIAAEGKALLEHPGSLARDSPVFIETVALLQATAPPPDGKYALVLPPAGASLAALAAELEALGTPCMPLVPEAMAKGIPRPQPGTNPVLIALRESLTGLHLPHLHTVYLVNGIDKAALTPNKRKNGGRRELSTTYARIAGRLGRLGTSAADKPQRVISLLPAGYTEKHALFQTLEEMGERLADWNDVDLSEI